MRRGFTLIELIVVIGVITIVMTLVLASVFQSLASARRLDCASRLRQIGLALGSYHAVHNQFPSACGFPELPPKNAMAKQYSAHTQLLPYIEQSTLYNQMNFSLELEDEFVFPTASGSGNQTAYQQVIATLLCPADNSQTRRFGFGEVNYRVNLGATAWNPSVLTPKTGTLLCYYNTTYADVTDGTSSTIAFSERSRGSSAGGRSITQDLVIGDFSGFFDVDTAATYCRSIDIAQRCLDTWVQIGRAGL